MSTSLRITKMPVVGILNKDLVIEVDIDGDKVGEFRISKGSIDFYEKNAKSSHYKMSWANLAQVFIDNGKQSKK